MRFLFKKYLTITISLFGLTQFIPSIVISGGWKEFFYASAILTILFYIVRPLAGIIMLPINLLTLNLFSWILNIVVFYFWTFLVSEVKVGNWQFAGFTAGPLVASSFNFVSWQVIIISAVVLTIIIQFLDWLIK